MANPYEPGTDEYLDYATAQHDKAMAPKKKIMKKEKKPMQKVKQQDGGLAQMLNDYNESGSKKIASMLRK